MSDLAATNCGGGCNNIGGGNSCLWLILILIFCGGCGNGIGGGFMNDGDCGCNSLIWILLILCFCGNKTCC